MDKAEKAGGNLVDLPPDRLEGYGLDLLLKRVAAYTSKQFHLTADGDMKVNLFHQHLSPTFVTNMTQNICDQYFVINILSPIFCHQFFVTIFVTNFLSPFSALS